MRVDIEESHLDIYKRLANDINNASRKLRIGAHKINPAPYRKLLLNTNLSIEKKKKELVKHLHKCIVKTFSVNINKVPKKAVLNNLQNNILILRAIVDKLRSINHYIEDSFLRESGIVRKKSIIKSFIPQKVLLKNKNLGKKELEKLDYLVYKMIEKVIFLDKKLLKGFKKKEENIVKRKKLETKDIENILNKESVILMHLEAKLPPSGKINSKLVKNRVLHNWVVRIFALLSGFENEYQKENIIFKKLKGSESLRKKIDKKIKNILKEKEKLLRLKEKRASSMKRLNIDNEWRRIFHHFNAASRL